MYRESMNIEDYYDWYDDTSDKGAVMRWGLIERKWALNPSDMTARWVDFADGPHKDKGDDEWIQFVLFHEYSDEEWERDRTEQAVRQVRSPRR